MTFIITWGEWVQMNKVRVGWGCSGKLRLMTSINTLSPRENGDHFADDIFKCIFMNENVWISIKISLKFVHKGPINNNPALVQIMACRRVGDKPLSEPMLTQFTDAYMRHEGRWVKYWHA